MTMTKVVKTAAQTAADEAEIMRLTNMTVAEVSPVDRAANKKTFVAFKSAAQGPELEPDGKGGYLPPAAPEPTVTIETAKAEPAATVPEPAPAPVEDPAPLVKVEVPDALVAAVLATPSTIEKVGRKVSREREEKLRRAIEMLLSVLDEAAANSEAEKAAVAKATSDADALRKELAAVKHELNATKQAHETTKSQYASHVRSVAQARSTVPTSKVLRPDEVQAQIDTRVSWPADLTREYHELHREQE